MNNAITYETLYNAATTDISRDDVDDTDGRTEGKVWCRRCSTTGRFVTMVLNDKPAGPGGTCFRCNGKGYHTQADRKRNYGWTMNQRVY